MNGYLIVRYFPHATVRQVVSGYTYTDALAALVPYEDCQRIEMTLLGNTEDVRKLLQFDEPQPPEGKLPF